MSSQPVNVQPNNSESRGVSARVVDGRDAWPAFIVGPAVPEALERGPFSTCYRVIDHAEGAQVVQKDGTRRRLLAYPAEWPSPGRRGERWVYAHHDRLPWNAPVPISDEVPDTILLDEERERRANQ